MDVSVKSISSENQGCATLPAIEEIEMRAQSFEGE